MANPVSAGPSAPGQGFQFPGQFELTAMGPAAADLASLVPALLRDAGVVGVSAVLRQRPSRGGKYCAVTVSIHAQSRADYECAHAALRAHPDVKWTL
jgi:putative lipoic acid-binding regulatory protein